MTITDSDTWNTPFLQGALAPVFDERDDHALEVIGEIRSLEHQPVTDLSKA